MRLSILRIFAASTIASVEAPSAFVAGSTMRLSEYTTSSAVNADPSCHVTPERNSIVQRVASEFAVALVASAGFRAPVLSFQKSKLKTLKFLITFWSPAGETCGSLDAPTPKPIPIVMLPPRRGLIVAK